MEQIQHNAPNRMYVFQSFSWLTPRTPHLVMEPKIGPLPSKILAARLV